MDAARFKKTIVLSPCNFTGTSIAVHVITSRPRYTGEIWRITCPFVNYYFSITNYDFMDLFQYDYFTDSLDHLCWSWQDVYPFTALTGCQCRRMHDRICTGGRHNRCTTVLLSKARHFRHLQAIIGLLRYLPPSIICVCFWLIYRQSTTPVSQYCPQDIWVLCWVGLVGGLLSFSDIRGKILNGFW